VAVPPPSFAAIYEEHVGFVWRVLRRLGVPESHTDDAVQDVFLIVHRRLAEFARRSSMRTWLFGIARRVAADWRRRHARKESRLVEAGPDTIVPLQDTPADAVEQSQAVRLLHAILDEMDDDKRAVFVLVELEEMSAPEAAEALQSNLNTVYSRLRAARQQFARAVDRHAARYRSDEHG
jgi:RNA polymerase sigma-70 factor (ECF subfamily)